MLEFLSPIFSSFGTFNATSSLIFLRKKPSHQFFNLWKKFNKRQTHLIKNKDGSETLDFIGREKREALGNLELLIGDEKLEFLHWLSIDIHEYIHAYDIFSTNFGNNIIFKTLHNSHLLYKLINSQRNNNIKFPLTDNIANKASKDYLDKYYKVLKLTNLFLGAEPQIKEYITEK